MLMCLVLTKNLGDIALRVRLRYQACGDTVCHPPEEIVLELPLAGLDNIRD